MKIFKKNTVVLVILFFIFSACYAQDANEYCREGMEDMSVGKFGQAREKFEEAFSIDESSLSAQIGLSIIEAVEKQKIKREAAIYTAKGGICADLEKYDTAISLYRQAIAINPDFATAHLALGVVYRVKGMYDEAINEFKKVITIDPNYAIAYYNLGLAYYHKGEYKSAIKYCNKAWELGYRSLCISQLLEALHLVTEDSTRESKP